MTLKPDTTNAQYDEFFSTWETCRDASTGQRAVHKKAKKYLPALDEQTTEQYTKYLQRALYFNATGRTVDAMLGLVFRKKGTIKVPKAMESWLEDITMTGVSFEGFSKIAFEETLKVGRFGILIDMPTRPATPDNVEVTIAQAQAMNLRPFFVSYKTEAILNWEFARIGSKTYLINVFLQEDVDDDMAATYDKQVRQLTLASGYYQQIVWRRKKQDNQVADSRTWESFEPTTPIKDGQPLDWIPFWFVAPKEGDADVQEPPIEDLAYINIAHYMNSADYENGLHLSGLPTPYATGVNDPENKFKLAIGSTTAVLFTDPNSKFGYAQVGAEGFKALENGMKAKEEMMAAIGARMIAPEKRAAETAETASIKKGSENSILAEFAGTIEKTLEQCLKWAADWQGLEGAEVDYELNKDYLPVPMDAQSLTALVKAWQSNAISQQTFFEAMQAGNVIPESRTFEEEKAFIDEAPPPLVDVGAGGGA